MRDWLRTALAWSLASIGMTCASVALGDGIAPPIGQRKYVIPRNAPHKPTVIVNQDRSVKEVYLRDPVQPAGRTLKKSVKKKKKKKPLPKYKPAQLSFAPEKIVGRLATPRVQFDQVELPVRRADEFAPRGFLDRIRRNGESL